MITSKDKLVWQAIGMWKSGLSKHSIATILRVDRRTLRRWIERYRRVGDYKRIIGSGRKRKTSNREERMLLRTTKANPFASGPTLHKLCNFSASIRTLRRLLNENGMISGSPKFVPLLTESHKRIRLDWAMRRCLWRFPQWGRIIWTDESRFTLRHRDGRLKVWRLKGGNSYMKYTHPVVQGDGGSLHVWGAIWMNGKSNLVVLQRNVNAEEYRRILTEHLLPITSEMENYIFQDDNAAPHRAKIVHEFKTNAQIRSLPWPARSPDLNPIEHVWDYLGRKIKEGGVLPDLNSLKSALITSWNEMPITFVNRLIESMPRRIGEVIEAKGGNTRY